jgi:hypothetical protein
MSWGKRFGPPYPLGGVDKKVARAEAKRKKQQEKRVAALQKAAKKARKAKVKAAKKEKKELERQVKINEQKQKLLEEDNYKKIMKNRKLFTNEELKYIKERHDQQIADKLDRMINRAAKVTTLVNTVSNVSQGLKMLQGLKEQSKLNALEIQKFEQDVANKKQLAESTKNIAEQNKYKAEQEKQKSVQEMHKVTQEYFKGQKEKQSAYADAYSKFNQSYKDFFDTEKTKKEYSDWINQNTKSDRKVYTLKNATVKDILNQRNSTHEPEFNSKAAYKFKPSGVNISQLANRHSQNASAISQQVMQTRISDLSKSPYTSAMATNSGHPYANRTINNMLNNMTTEYYQRQIPSSSELKDMLKNSKNNYSFYNMLL